MTNAERLTGWIELSDDDGGFLWPDKATPTSDNLRSILAELEAGEKLREACQTFFDAFHPGFLAYRASDSELAALDRIKAALGALAERSGEE